MNLARDIAELKRRLYELERASAGHEADEPLPAAGKISAVVCRVGDNRIALPLEQVERAVAAAAMSPLPEAPPWVHGLLNLGGHAIAVLDVAARIERSRRVLELDDQIVICRTADASVGLVVQEVLGVHLFELAESKGASSVSVPLAPYVRATQHDAQGLVLLFSLKRLLATSDIPPLEPPGNAEGEGLPR